MGLRPEVKNLPEQFHASSRPRASRFFLVKGMDSWIFSSGW
jgi:hypothetical protein